MQIMDEETRMGRSISALIVPYLQVRAHVHCRKCIFSACQERAARETIALTLRTISSQSRSRSLVSV